MVFSKDKEMTVLEQLSYQLRNSSEDALKRHEKFDLPIICGYNDKIVQVYKNLDGTLKVI